MTKETVIAYIDDDDSGEGRENYEKGLGFLS